MLTLDGCVFAPDAGGGGSASGTGGEKAGEKGIYLPQLSPELRKDERVVALAGKYPRLNDLVSGALDMDSRLGRAIVVPNAETPDPAEVKTFREKLGIPDEYDIKLDGAKGLDGAEGLAGMVKETAKALTLTHTQAQKLFDALAGISKTSREASAKATKAAEDAFDGELLKAVDGKEDLKTAAANLFKRFLVQRIGDQALVRQLKASGLLDNPAFALKMAQFEDFFSEEPFFKGSSRGDRPKPAAQGQFGGSYSPDFAGRYGGRK